MQKFLLIFPTVFEAAPAFAALDKTKKARLGETALSADGIITALVAGIGCDASVERVETALQKSAPDFAILAGFCGACTADERNGDFIFDGESEKLAALAESLGGIRGKIATVGEIADKKRKTGLGERGFRGVDMEGELFRKAAETAKVPFGHFRWISDSLESDIPPSFFESTIDRETGDLKVSALKTATAIIRTPSLLPRLARFGAEIAPAKRKYAKDIAEIIRKIGSGSETRS